MLGRSIRSLLRRNSQLCYLVVACGTGLLLGVACLWFSPLWALIALAGGGLAFAALKRPEIALLGILVATSSIVFENKLPLIHVGGGLHLHVPDVVLVALLGLITLRWLVEPGFGIIRTPLDWPILAFYGVSLLWTFVAILWSPGTDLVFREVWVVTYYLIFFVVTNLVREEHQLRFLLRGFSILATVVAVAMIVQFLVGESVSLLPGRVETLRTHNTRYSNIARILPPGQSLIVVAFITTGVKLVLDGFGSSHVLRFFQWSLLGLAVLLTFNRNFYVIVGLALLVLVCLVKGRDRQRLIGWGLVITILMTTTLLPIVKVSEPDSRTTWLANAFIDRLSTLVSGETLGESGVQFRYIETGYAVSQIASHPAMGLGLGASYRPFDSRLDSDGFDGRRYVHNGHLYILLKSGLLGYVCLVWLSLTFLVRGFKYWRYIPDSQMRGVVLGFTLTYLGIPFATIVNPIFMQWFWTPVIGIMMGVNEVILRGIRRHHVA